MELGLVRIEGTLRQTGEVVLVGRIDRLVVADRAVALKYRAAHLLAILQVHHAPPKILVAGNAAFVAHDQVGVLARLRLQHREIPASLDPRTSNAGSPQLISCTSPEAAH